MAPKKGCKNFKLLNLQSYGQTRRRILKSIKNNG